MGYHITMLDPEASKTCNIIFPRRKCFYLKLRMGISSSPDILQAKLSELMVAMEIIHAYIDDLICIKRTNLDDHLQKLDRNQQDHCVSKLEIIMVFHFETNFLLYLCEPTMIKNYNLYKAIFYHIWKLNHYIKALKRGMHVS